LSVLLVTRWPSSATTSNAAGERPYQFGFTESGVDQTQVVVRGCIFGIDIQRSQELLCSIAKQGITLLLLGVQSQLFGSVKQRAP
jgi:hypothetical protein